MEPSEALRRLHEHAEHLDVDRDTVEFVAGTVAAAAAGTLPDALRQQLAHFLRRADADGRDLTALLLADVAGVTALPDLVAAAEVDMGDQYLLHETIDGLIRSGGAMARWLLTDMIGNGSSGQRAAALRLLEPIVEPADVTLLGGAASDPDPKIRVPALEALAGLPGDAAAVTLLVGGLQDQDPGVRAAAIDLLAGQGDPAAVAPLSPLTTDPEPRVRRRLAYALGRLGRDEGDGGPAQATLQIMLRDDDPAVRDRAQAALGEIGGAQAAGMLLAGASSADPRQRAHAAKALARLVDEDPRAEERIRSLARDPDAGVRAAVLSGLATVGDITGRWESLVNALAGDSDVTVRHRVVGTAVHLLPYPDEILILLSTDPSGFVREAAALALSRRRR